MQLEALYNCYMLLPFAFAGLVIGDRGFKPLHCWMRSFTHIASVTKQYNLVPLNNGVSWGVNRHTVRRVHGLAASAGVWLRATVSEISATLWAKWLGKDFTFIL